jgi:hypothetical protein
LRIPQAQTRVRIHPVLFLPLDPDPGRKKIWIWGPGSGMKTSYDIIFLRAYS